MKKLIQMTLTILAAMMVSTGHAGEPPKCAVSLIPVQIAEVATPAPWPNKTYDSEPHFRRFVTAITEHLSAWQAKEKLCLDAAGSRKPSLLKFEKWPDFTAGNEPSVQPQSFDERPSGGCRITSPWIDIAVARKPAVWIRAVVRWNPRQVYVDQAILDGARNVPPGVAIPMAYGEFSRFAEDYLDVHADGAYVKYRTDGLRARQKLVEERISPDLVWLFRSTSTRMRGPFADRARYVMHAAMSNHADDYTKLVIALIDRCVATEGVDRNYQSILDVADLISLEKYKLYIGPVDF